MIMVCAGREEIKGTSNSSSPCPIQHFEVMQLLQHTSPLQKQALQIQSDGLQSQEPASHLTAEAKCNKVLISTINHHPPPADLAQL